MARAGSTSKTYLSMLRRDAKQVRFYLTNQAAVSYQPAEKARNSTPASELPCWVPHPGNGIYVPKGNERMMDDVPKSSDTLNQTYWLRNEDDALEKPVVDTPDTPPYHPYVSNNKLYN